ncbi:hypothetical protein C8Q72DRAFT_109533 [Fomitopsis betulina]|nr:hypothetical protein C8Q72DRAFT_109533 [Fomitopsis betulina]
MSRGPYPDARGPLPCVARHCPSCSRPSWRAHSSASRRPLYPASLPWTQLQGRHQPTQISRWRRRQTYNRGPRGTLLGFRCGVSNGVITTTLVALASLQPTEVTNLRLRPHQGRLRANSMQQHLQAATLSISFPSNIGPLPSTRVHRLVQERRTRSPLHDAHRRRHSDRRSFLRGRYPPRRVAQPLIMTNPPLSQHCLRPTNTRTEPLRGTAPRCRWAVAVS